VSGNYADLQEASDSERRFVQRAQVMVARAIRLLILTLDYTGQAPVGPLWRPCGPRPTPIATTGELPFRVRLGPDDAARIRLVA
jgi:hypothetical protein